MNEFKTVIRRIKDDIFGYNLDLLGLNENNMVHKRKIADINELISECNAAIKKLKS